MFENSVAKYVILGAQGVGKTTLACCLVGKPYGGPPKYPSPFLKNFTQDVKDSGKDIRIEAWELTDNRPALKMLELLLKSHNPVIYIVINPKNKETCDAAEKYIQSLKVNKVDFGRVCLVANNFDSLNGKHAIQETLARSTEAQGASYCELDLLSETPLSLPLQFHMPAPVIEKNIKEEASAIDTMKTVRCAQLHDFDEYSSVNSRVATTVKAFDRLIIDSIWRADKKHKGYWNNLLGPFGINLAIYALYYTIMRPALYYFSVSYYAKPKKAVKVPHYFFGFLLALVAGSVGVAIGVLSLIRLFFIYPISNQNDFVSKTGTIGKAWSYFLQAVLFATAILLTCGMLNLLGAVGAAFAHLATAVSAAVIPGTHVAVAGVAEALALAYYPLINLFSTTRQGEAKPRARWPAVAARFF